MPDAVLPVLVGEDSGQTLEDIEVTFPTPAVEIDEPTKRVEIERCEAIPGKVIVVGRVVKNIPFKTRAGESHLSRDGRRRVRMVCGDLRHCTLFIPFRLFVEIPGAREGDVCEVVEACVLGEVDTLIDSNVSIGICSQRGLRSAFDVGRLPDQAANKSFEINVLLSRIIGFHQRGCRDANT
ncbi:MAG: hypothetical protein K0R39_4414 [Symbiobacteriaceae bacterium]|jgi:hypothetical protein|nr:hypothetical protein [Symbiobacteriaceae bacterium]